MEYCLATLREDRIRWLVPSVLSKEFLGKTENYDGMIPSKKKYGSDVNNSVYGLVICSAVVHTQRKLHCK